MKLGTSFNSFKGMVKNNLVFFCVVRLETILHATNSKLKPSFPNHLKGDTSAGSV